MVHSFRATYSGGQNEETKGADSGFLTGRLIILTGLILRKSKKRERLWRRRRVVEGESLKERGGESESGERERKITVRGTGQADFYES